MAEPHIYKASRGRAIVYGGFSAVFLTIANNLYRHSEQTWIQSAIFIAVAIACGSTIVANIRALFFSPPQLVLTEEGLSSPQIAPDLVLWSDIASVDTMPNGAKKYLCIMLKPDAHYVAQLPIETRQRTLDTIAMGLPIFKIEIHRLAAREEDVILDIHEHLDALEPDEFELAEDLEYDGFYSPAEPNAKVKELTEDSDDTEFFPLTIEEYHKRIHSITATLRAHGHVAHADRVEEIGRDSDTLFEGLTVVTDYLLRFVDSSTYSLIEEDAEALRQALDSTGWEFH